MILLNTDAFNRQIKNRMTKADFIKNNKGIDDGKNISDEYLSAIYDDITSNEIRMKDEVEGALTNASPAGLAGALANVGRDLQREAYVLQSNNMANKSEASPISLCNRIVYTNRNLGPFQDVDESPTKGLWKG